MERTEASYPVIETFDSIPVEYLPTYKGKQLPVTFFAKRGGLMYDTFDPDIDDQDYIGVFLPSDETLYSFTGDGHHSEILTGPMDLVYYSIHKFMSLVAKGSPNVILPLFNPMYQSVIHRNIITNLLPTFVTKDLFDRTLRFAIAQADETLVLEKKFKGYNGEKRKKLIQELGYDPKNACSALILFYICGEIAQFPKSQTLSVAVDERDFYMSVKRGYFSKDEIGKLLKMHHDRAESLDTKYLPVVHPNWSLHLSKRYIRGTIEQFEGKWIA